MRDPRRAVAKLPGWQTVGRLLSKVLDEALSRSPGFIAMVEKLGADMTCEESQAAGQTLQEGGTVAAKLAERALGASDLEATKGPTGWRWKLMDSLRRISRDPD